MKNHISEFFNICTKGVCKKVEKMIKAVIFDMDGVLIDTEKHYNAAWCEAARGAGFDFTRQHALLLRSLDARLASKLMKDIFGRALTILQSAKCAVSWWRSALQSTDWKKARHRRAVSFFTGKGY